MKHTIPSKHIRRWAVITPYYDDSSARFQAFEVTLFADDGHGEERILGYIIGRKFAANIAKRLVTAWGAGALGGKLLRRPFAPGITRNGCDTYLSTSQDMPIGRYLNTDLQRAGF